MRISVKINIKGQEKLYVFALLLMCCYLLIFTVVRAFSIAITLFEVLFWCFIVSGSITFLYSFNKYNEKIHQNNVNGYEVFCDSQIFVDDDLKTETMLGFTEIEQILIDWDKNTIIDKDLFELQDFLEIPFVKEHKNKFYYYLGKLGEKETFKPDGAFFDEVVLILPINKEIALKSHDDVGIDVDNYIVWIKKVDCYWKLVDWYYGIPYLRLIFSENMVSTIVN